MDAEDVEGQEDQLPLNLGLAVEHPLADALEIGFALSVEGDELPPSTALPVA